MKYVVCVLYLSFCGERRGAANAAVTANNSLTPTQYLQPCMHLHSDSGAPRVSIYVRLPGSFDDVCEVVTGSLWDQNPRRLLGITRGEYALWFSSNLFAHW